jgi:hypothetical protein
LHVAEQVKQSEMRRTECAEALQNDQSTQLSSSRRESAAASFCTRCKLVCALTWQIRAQTEREVQCWAQLVHEVMQAVVLCCLSVRVFVARFVFVFAVFCIFVAQAKTQCSTSPGYALQKDPNGSCNELLEPEW